MTSTTFKPLPVITVIVTTESNDQARPAGLFTTVYGTS
nr:MAG TPA: hypothetical protein [Caudoviricetes sp.]